MSLSVAVIDALVEAGATREQLAAAIKADIAVREAVEAAKLEKKREGNRTRQKRKRDNERNAESRVTAVTERDARDTPPVGSPKDIYQTPSLPPAQCSEPNGSSTEPRAWALPLGVSLQVWTDFKRNRQRKRLPNTDTAWKAFNDDLKRIAAQTGIPPPKLIEQCTAKGWGAIYDPREEPNVRRTDRMGRNQPADGLSSTARAALSVFGASGAGQH